MLQHHGLGLGHIDTLIQLRGLSLASLINITDKGLEHVGEHTQLERLHLAGCKRITNTGLAHVAHVKKLTA